jgi:hypothetical protein
MILYTQRTHKIAKEKRMTYSFKPNTTINIPVEVLERARSFLAENPEIKSRNLLIEKSLAYFMDHWEEIKKIA